jgi:hypothetical protein
MNTLILQCKKITPLCLILCTLGCFAFSPTAQAAPAPNTPDPGDVGGVLNTADGFDAMPFMSAGTANSAFGAFTLFSAVSCNFNTAVGAGALDFNTADGNTAVGAAGLLFNTTGQGNTAVGAAALQQNTEGGGNTAVGALALKNNAGGILSSSQNTAIGQGALEMTTGSARNTAVGREALNENTTGNSNTAVGVSALSSNTAGSDNIAVGDNAGVSLTTGDNNIDIGNEGVADEANTIRIGTSETQTATFIAGISGTAVVGDPVVVDANGQLGTATSSARFKKDIKPMDKTSEAILGLKPATFHYKSDSKGTPQFGLVAEDVAKVNPDLVVRDRNGEIYSVRYEAVNAMLLNEFLKEHRKNEQQQATIAQLKSGMEALTATVKEQAAQIQKVSAQLEASKPVPQVVNNP